MRHKYERLDSLRWIATFSVGIYHAFQCFHPAGHLSQIYLYYGTMVFNGAYAVYFFLVLSGFVLINATPALCIDTYIGFIIRRLFRIYPAAWMSLMLSGVAIAVVHLFPRLGLPWVSPWAEWLLQIPPISLIGATKTILLYAHTMNPVLWTILIELIASVFYPFFAHILRKQPTFFYLYYFLSQLQYHITSIQTHLRNSGFIFYTCFWLELLSILLDPTLHLNGEISYYSQVLLLCFCHDISDRHTPSKKT